MTLEEALRENAALRAENAWLKQQLEELLRKLAAAEARIAELEREVARQAAPFRRREELKVPPEQRKTPGRKPGHRGARRQRPGVVDERIDVPLACCPQCGGQVEERRPLTQYIEEIPPLRPRVTRLTTWQARCRTCGEVHSSHPLQTSRAQGAAGVQLGPRAQALATLIKGLGLTLGKTCQVLRQGFGLSLSRGGLTQLLARVARKRQGDYQKLIDQIRGSPVVYADETSWYVGAPGYWLWVFTTPEATLYHVAGSRGGPVAEKILGADFSGVLVSDCFSAYNRFGCEQHKCVAHHLQAIKRARDKPGTPQRDYLDAWEQLWKDVLTLSHARTTLPVEQRAEQRAEQRLSLESRIDELIAQTVTQPGDRAVRTRMINARKHLLTCLKHEEVEATNNRAERAIRPAVIVRKASCGNRTEQGAETWQTLASLAATAHQTATNFIDDLIHAVQLSPMPAG